MQTKHLFLLLALAFLACVGLHAQVTERVGTTTNTYGTSKSREKGGFDALLVGRLNGGGIADHYALYALLWSSSSYNSSDGVTGTWALAPRVCFGVTPLRVPCTASAAKKIDHSAPLIKGCLKPAAFVFLFPATSRKKVLPRNNHLFKKRLYLCQLNK
jgi:hypothetical protein